MGFVVDWDSDSAASSDSRSNQFWQSEFFSEPSNDSCKALSLELASQPHIAGEPAQLETGQFVFDFFDSLSGVSPLRQRWNDTVLDHFVASSLKLFANGSWTALDIAEEAIASDPDTDTEVASHVWSAYSANGTVSGRVVYINFGRRRDYRLLIDDSNFSSITSNASFSGKIGLVRFGGGMGRATKVQLAQEFGLIGLLMFSDPEQYALNQSAVYPFGPWLPPSGVQRGSVKFASCPGNPTLARLQSLCGLDSLADAMPSIPVMPLSYANAKRFFLAMTDAQRAPSSWHGAIDVAYRVDSALTAELTVITELRGDDVTENVYGVMSGAVFPKQFVMIGAHRDSWVYGAQDDVSGTVTVLEVAQGLSALYRRGWRPKRSLVFASWDSEESGLIGSTNFGEGLQLNRATNALKDLEGLEALDEGLFAYLNLDMTTGGDDFAISGHPLLALVSRDAMRATPIRNARLCSAEMAPCTFWSLFGDVEFGILGQGSDHTVFAFHLGVAAADLGFGGATAFAAYHSVYDTNGWQETVDSDWMIAEDIARFTGVLTMKLTDATVLPLNLNILAARMSSWFANELSAAMTEFGCDADAVLARNATLEMHRALSEFTGAAFELTTLIDNVANRTDIDLDDDADLEAVDRFNELLGSTARLFMFEEGLPERTWHKNILWNTAIEDGPDNVFPFIWYALQFECTPQMLTEAFNVTQSIVEEATKTLLSYATNATNVF